MPFSNSAYQHRFVEHGVATDADPDEVPVHFDGLPQTFTYVGSNLSTITVVANGVTYVKTHTYVNGNLTGVSGWVAQ